ncbi:peptidase E [Candidatus Woesearchaeota archaeon]|nr:MAG: peptidase E [Candidatus Woesearchaeota archaeon]
MGKIVALGGGEIGRFGKVETTAIDKEIVKLSGKKHPHVLFIPTASHDSENYARLFRKQYEKLSCKVDILYLYNKVSKTEIKNKIFSSDILYVGGGNTLKMVKLWRKKGVDALLKKAYKKNIVLSGVSAGAICWFKYGNSDSRKFKNPKADLIKVKGLNLFPLLFCPHYDAEKGRVQSLKNMMKKGGVAIALDNCCAIEIIENRYKIIASKKSAHAYKVYWKTGTYHHEILQKNVFRDIKELVKK